MMHAKLRITHLEIETDLRQLDLNLLPYVDDWSKILVTSEMSFYRSLVECPKTKQDCD